jgi:L-lysine exporter family protein LysE/ArgO
MMAFITGVGLGASLIIAIGAQNAFVLGQSIRRNYAYTIAITCALVDALLITVGIWGLGAFIESRPGLLAIITLGGSLFLFVYGMLAFKRALKPKALQGQTSAPHSSALSAILTTLALSLLNPHVYLDTVLLLGSIGGRLPPHESRWFAAGAMFASFAWFLGLALGGKLLAPILNSPRHWQRLDMIIGLIMWAISFSLLSTWLRS